ncbi:MAG: AraC family transcriptional regulator [Steroidobacteraceae bacterium]
MDALSETLRVVRLLGAIFIQGRFWRMVLAANLLCRSNAPLAQIAEDVGYQTDTAFIRAFRREYGLPPAAWRRQQSTRPHVP